jgi:O-Antigen ligase
LTRQSAHTVAQRSEALKMSWTTTALLCGLFAAATLVQIRLPVVHFSANNLVAPLFAASLAWCERDAAVAALRRHARLLLATGILYAWVWLSALNGVLPSLSMRIAGKYGGYLFVFGCLLVLLQREAAWRPAQRTVHAVLVGFGVLGVLEYWFPVFPFTQLRGQLVVYPRVASLLLWPNQLGVLMAIAVALGAALHREGRLATWADNATQAVFLLALALSGSRNGWCTFAALLVVSAATRVMSVRRAVVLGLGFFLLVLSFPVPRAQLGLRGLPVPQAAVARPDLSHTNTPAQTLAPRLALWRAAIAEIGRHPLSGLGPEVFATTIGPRITGQTGINTHDLPLNLATDLGLVGLLLATVWLTLLLRAGDLRRWTTSLPLLGLSLGQLVDCFTYDYTFIVFGLFFAACYASVPGEAG